MSGNFLPRLGRRAFVVASLFCLGLLPIVLMIHHVQANWTPLPTWDDWNTPGNQFDSWCNGTLTISELFSQHNESRMFFPKIVYFALALAGGWDARKETAVIFLIVCLLSALIWRLMRKTPGSTLMATLIAWMTMMFICFSPGQLENFTWGILLGPFLVGLSVVVAATVNLSRLSLVRKTSINALLAFGSTYSFANGMLLWLLGVPVPAFSNPTSRREKLICFSLYSLAAGASITWYFAGYNRPAHHPKLASPWQQGRDLIHYLVLWIGSYFSSEKVDPLMAGIVVSLLLALVGLTMLVLIYHKAGWRTFYPWLLMGAYAFLSGLVTAFGRLGFGVQQALDSRYRVFSLFAYLALVGGCFAIYCAHIRTGSQKARALFLIPVSCVVVLTGLCWVWCYDNNVALIRHQREKRVNLLGALEWSIAIPDNPDLALIFPYIDQLRDKARRLADHRLLHLSLVRAPLSDLVHQLPSDVDESHGQIETCTSDNGGFLFVTGWAWLPDRNRRADFVVIGCENSAGEFKPVSVVRTGGRRRDLNERFHIPRIEESGFSRTVNPANFLPGDITIAGWAIDLKGQRAWPLAGSQSLRR